MQKLKNYIGQLRVYSLADLILLLFALRADLRLFIGAIILHLAFLVYLESNHSHSYRAKIPRSLSYILAIVGIVIYGKIEGIIYILFSFLYTQKIKGLGFISPLLRGLQNFFIAGGIVGYHSPIPYIVGGLFLIRNLAGDFRDTGKDMKERLNTIPIIIGMKNNVQHIHLILIVFTSAVWWYLSSLSVIWLLAVVLIEISTYRLTAR